MEKRGQTTVFIIIGIVLIALVVLFFFISGRIISLIQPEEIPDINSYVQGCLDSVVKEGQGVAMRTSTEQLNFESRLREYVINFLPTCTDFPSLKNDQRFKEYIIREEPIQDVIVTLIPSRSLTVEVDWPIRLIKGDKISLVNNFVTKDNLKLACCFPITVDDYLNCRAIESRLVNVCGISKQFNVGDKISFNLKGVGDICYAC